MVSASEISQFDPRPRSRSAEFAWPVGGMVMVVGGGGTLSYLATRVFASPMSLMGWTAGISIWLGSLVLLGVLRAVIRIPPTTRDAAARTLRFSGWWMLILSLTWWAAIIAMGAIGGNLPSLVGWGFVIASPPLGLATGVLSMGFTRSWPGWIPPVAVAAGAAAVWPAVAVRLSQSM